MWSGSRNSDAGNHGLKKPQGWTGLQLSNDVVQEIRCVAAGVSVVFV